MTMSTNASGGSRVRRALFGLCSLVPLLMGGCPEFRNDIVGVFETATRTALLGADDATTIVSAVRVSLVDATIDLVYDQFLTDD